MKKRLAESAFSSYQLQVTLPPAGGPVGVTHNVRQTNLVSPGFANLLGTEQLKNSLVRFTHKAGGFLQRSRIRSSCI